MELLQILHLSINLVNVSLDLLLNVYVDGWEVASTQLDRTLAGQTSAIIELVAIVSIL